MDTVKPLHDSQLFSLTPAVVAARLGAPDAPLVIDVRSREAYRSPERTLPGALRREPGELDRWASALPAAPTVLVYGAHGNEVSQNTVLSLRERGTAAQFLQGEMEAWHQQRLPVDGKPADSATRWITQERPKIDRIACPWLVRRFVDEPAQFLYARVAQLRTVAQQQKAVPYDVSTDVAPTRFTHEGAHCSFDAQTPGGPGHAGSHDAGVRRALRLVPRRDTGTGRRHNWTPSQAQPS